LTDRRRHIPRQFRALILNHLTSLQGQTRCPTAFYQQFVARAPSFELCEKLEAAFVRANSLLEEGTETPAAQLHEAAIAMALVATHQLSLRDLAVLDVGRHLERDREGRIRRIQMSGEEASIPLGIDLALPGHLAARLEQHLLKFRPLLPGAERSTKLFLHGDNTGLAIRKLRARMRLVELMARGQED
jgi:hypothetical protein